MRLKGIKFVQQGLKGLIVTYRETEQNNRFEFDDEFSIKKKRPVHADFKKAMQALERDFRLLLGIDERIGVEIQGVVAGEDEIQIQGLLRLVGGSSTSLNTPVLTEEEGYREWDKLNDRIDKLYNECRSYLTEGKSANAKQFVLDLQTSDPKFLEKKGLETADIKKMDEEGQYALMKEFLEKKGAIVIMDLPVEEKDTDKDSKEEIDSNEFVGAQVEDDESGSPFSKKRK